MASTNRLPPKKDVALALLEQSSIFVHLDPRSETVSVPSWFKKQPQLVLQIGLNMAIPIPDLMLDDEGLSCTLSFNRSPHLCRVPWSSVYALVGESGRGMVWPDDVPAEVAAQVQGQPSPAPKPRGHLHAVGEATAAKEEPVKPAKLPVQKPERAKRARKPKAKPVEQAAERAPQPQAGAQDPRPAAAPRSKPKSVPAVVAPTTTGSAVSSQKRKRELPPYLRVVK